MNPRPSIALVAVLALASVAAAAESEPRFFFDRSGEVGTFVALLPWPDGAQALRLGAADPAVVLVAPAERRPDGTPFATFAGRYRGAGSAEFSLESVAADGTVESRSLDVRLPATAESRDVELRYARCLLDEFSSRIERSGGDAFLGAAHEIVRRRHGLSPGEVPRPRSLTPPLRPLALYDAFTGSLALEESLQLESLFSEAPADLRDRSVSELSGPTIESHPFERMLEGRKPAIESSAFAVPADFLCARFPSIDALARATETFEGWGSTILSTVTVSGRTPRLRERLETEIRFRLSDEWRRALDPHLESVSIVSSDPFFFEGNDVTLLLEMRSEAAATLVAGPLARLAGALAGSDPALASAEAEYHGVTVRSVASADRRVSSHVASVGRFLLLSNSRAAVEAVLETIAGGRRSLGEAAEFAYMRSIQPRDAEEDGYVYLSDAFVRRVVGPELKIVEARRAACLGKRSALASAALLFRMENGRAPKDVAELLVTGGLPERAASCPDGSEITLDAAGDLGVCRVHGTGARSTPCLEIAVGRVSEREASRYDQFVREYNNYWRRFFDPVGIRLRLRDGVELDTVILPLIELSMYRDLKAAVASAHGRPLPPARAPGEVYRLAGRFEPERLVAMALFFPDVALGDVDDAARDALSGSFAISRFDGEPLLEFEAADYLSQLLRTGAGFDLALVPVLSALTAPTAVTLGTKDPVSAEAFVRAVRAALARASRSGRGLSALPTVRHYVLERPDGGAVDSVSIEALSFRFRVFFALADGRLVVSNRLDALEALVAPAAGETPEAEAFDHDLELSIRASEVRRSRPFLEIGQAESAREACLENLEPLTSLLEFGAVASDAAAIERETLRRFGAAFACPEGGRYSLESHAARCSRHGSLAEPVQEMRPAGAAARLFETLRDVRVQLEFTEEGLRTRVIVR